MEIDNAEVVFIQCGSLSRVSPSRDSLSSDESFRTSTRSGCESTNFYKDAQLERSAQRMASERKILFFNTTELQRPRLA